MSVLSKIEKQRLIKAYETSGFTDLLKANISKMWFLEENDYRSNDLPYRVYTSDYEIDESIGFIDYFSMIVVRTKGQAQDLAINFQHFSSNFSLSWGECAWIGEYFERLGKRYGLLKEFRENGIC